ncbi:uncharacterized protein LOC110749036 isoform X2 [Prunus avium]|uniref:Uncharacterized protein LOC110749036 isoform X2 n=1 Tax=Prunus avium TaxID=42229 RepID=A0A6P5RUG6_PRUAV|nr:uncharacterized protein LOC110749036 isoform X2 [Prunus avium]
MGICFGKRKKSTAEIVPQNQPTTTVRLYGSPRSTAYIRVALKYKAAAVSLRCVVADTCGGDDHNANENLVAAVEVAGSSSPQTERVSGPPSTLLQFIDTRFPHPPLLLQIGSAETTSLVAAVVKLTELQHRSMTWHLERLVRWTTDLVTRQNKRGGRGGEIDPTVGTARMEVRKLGRSYTQLLELMLEHAQMEERLLFPIFNFADPRICKAANEEHARDLPIMNGIKEDIKSIEVIDNGSPAYQEALSNFSKRLKSLQERYRQHFQEEERELLPYMEAAELNKEQQQRLLDECVDVMQESHSHNLFIFLLQGLLPHEAMRYLDLISMCSNKERTASMLQMIIDYGAAKWGQFVGWSGTHCPVAVRWNRGLSGGVPRLVQRRAIVVA